MMIKGRLLIGAQIVRPIGWNCSSFSLNLITYEGTLWIAVNLSIYIYLWKAHGTVNILINEFNDKAFSDWSMREPIDIKLKASFWIVHVYFLMTDWFRFLTFNLTVDLLFPFLAPLAPDLTLDPLDVTDWLRTLGCRPDPPPPMGIYEPF